MRIVGNIEHPHLKITIFKNDDRFSVKFEDGAVEQTYKFNAAQGIESLRAVKQQIDAVFLQKIEQGIAQMKIDRLAALQRNTENETPDEFEEII